MQKSAASDNSGDIKESDSGQQKAPVRTKPATASARQLLMGAAVAAAAFVIVLLLLSHAARSSAPAPVAQNDNAEKQAQINKPKFVRIERLTQQFRTNAAGISELEVRGSIKNSGARTVNSADLKCRFRTRIGEDAFLEIPLIFPTRLDDLEGGPLGPYETREFSARIGDFPAALEPEILDAEPVNISFPRF